MRLFHFSDDPDFGVFEPRPPRILPERRAGEDWLNGPLVWAIDPAQPARSSLSVELGHDLAHLHGLARRASSMASSGAARASSLAIDRSGAAVI